MRTYKIGEFVAHSGAVNCVRIGRSTAGVLATGGEDKKVNLWRTGQTEVVKSLCGLQSSVECVVFGEKEDTIAAGGANGTVKVWDMDTGKVSRSLTGHRSNCLSLAFTTSDTNCLISGSQDCTVKVWDLRRKEAITTYKGHNNSSVLKVAPSPDNKWVCSGSEDGELKVWDLSSGKVIKDGWRHSGRITGLEFNQVEFLMVSSGADRVVRVWDLEVWEEVECLGPEATAVQGIAYAPDGNVLLTASSDALKVWGLEPAVHHDTVPMDWRNLADLHLYYKDGQPRALGCCCSGSSVGVFMVDLRKVAPFCSSSSSAQLPGQQALPAAGAGSSSSRRTGPVVQEYTAAPLQATQQQQPARRADSGAEKDAAPAYMSLLSEAATASWGSPDAAEAGPLTRQLPRQRTPPHATPPTGLTASSSANSRQAGPSPAAPVRRAGPLHPSTAATSQQQQQPQHVSSNNFPDVEILVPARRPSAADVIDQPASSMQQPVSRGQQPQQAAANGRLQHGTSSSRANSGLAADVSQLAAGLAAASLQEASHRQQPQQQQASRSSSRPKEPPGALSATLAAWLDDLPESSAAAPPAAAAASAAHSKSSSRSSSMPASRTPSRQNLGSAGRQQPQQLQQQPAADPIMAAIAARPALKVELSRMVSALQVAKGFASRGNLEGAYKSALSQGDPALACMLLEAVMGRSDAFELNSLEPLIKLLELLLVSGQEQQVAVGLSVLGLVLRGPGQMVADVVGAPQPTGVDLSFESRRSKCLLLKMALEGLGFKVGVLSRGQGAVATRAQLLGEELKRIVA